MARVWHGDHAEAFSDLTGNVLQKFEIVMKPIPAGPRVKVGNQRSFIIQRREPLLWKSL